METQQEVAGRKTPLDFEPNILAVADWCGACAEAKKLYKAEIDAGKIRVVDIEEALDIEGLYDCVKEKNFGLAGIPVLARVENGKVCNCKVGY